MPPPMVTCSICNQQIMKAQTYAVGDGKRACKSHPGVVETKDMLEQKKKTDRQKEMEDLERKAKAAAERQDPKNLFKPRCCNCGKTGISEKEMYMAMLIMSEKEQLKGNPIHPFSPNYGEKFRAMLGLKDGETTEVISIFPAEGMDAALAKMRRDAKMFASLSGVVPLCQGCCNKFGFKRELPKIDFPVAMMLYDAIRPDIKEIAQKVLDAESEKN